MLTTVARPSPHHPLHTPKKHKKTPAGVVGGGPMLLLGLRTHFYKEFEMNARNQTWDLLLQRPYNDGGGENSTRVDGTLLSHILYVTQPYSDDSCGAFARMGMGPAGRVLGVALRLAQSY